MPHCLEPSREATAIVPTISKMGDHVSGHMGGKVRTRLHYNTLNLGV
jgi:hypothetical protein